MRILNNICNIIIISFLFPSFGYASDGIIQFKVYDDETKERVQTQKGYDPVYWHGFDILHKNGIKGDGNTIAFIEFGVNNKHPQFRKDQVTIVDCSQYEKIMGEDRAMFRSRRDSVISEDRVFMRVDSYGNLNVEHGTHVMGVVLGQPSKINQVSESISLLENESFPAENDEPMDAEKRDKFSRRLRFSGNHSGGCAPGAQGYHYIFSTYRICFHNVSQFHGTTSYEMGAALFSFQKYIDMELFPTASTPFLVKKLKALNPPLSEQEEDFFKNQPVDGSLMTAFREALKGPAFAISCSFKPFTIMDPTKKGAVPINILDELATLAEKNDKIFIWAAGNDSRNLEEKDNDVPDIETFFQQVNDHPILSKRTIIALNAYPTTEDDPARSGYLVLRKKMIPLKLHPDSNYPCNKLKQICLSAVGSCILSGYGDNHKRMTGTSQAAPIIASLANLVYFHAKKQDSPMNGIEVIEHLKKTALPLSNPNFGCGYIWAPAALGIKEDVGGLRYGSRRNCQKASILGDY